MTTIYYHPRSTNTPSYNEGIENDSVFICDGSTYEYCPLKADIGDNVTFIKKNTGHLLITGNIGQGVTFLIEGLGSVSISGAVPDSTKFILKGPGSLSFSIKPSKTVIDNIEERPGAGKINFQARQEFAKDAARTNLNTRLLMFKPLNTEKLTNEGYNNKPPVRLKRPS